MGNFTETVFLVLVAGFILRLLVLGIIGALFKGWLPMFMSPVGAIGAVSLTLLHYSYNSDFEALMIVIGFFLPEYFGILSQFKKEKGV